MYTKNKKLYKCINYIMLKRFLLVVVLIIVVSALPIIIFFSQFKIEYKDIITNELKGQNILSKSLIFAIIKAESNFDENAKSNKDAFGLMQITFPTAQELAGKEGIQITINDLYNPNINIKLGVRYLEDLYEIFGDINYIILAYNAGPNRVKSWIENEEIKKEKGQIKTPFIETTNYIKKVLNNQKIYKIILKEKWWNYLQMPR